MPPKAKAVLDRYIRSAAQQEHAAVAYTDTVTVRAQLPGVKKQGEFVLRSRYVAPNELSYKPVRYTGDGFVKTQVILGYLGRQVEHVKSGTGEDSALTEKNFTFTYAGEQTLSGTPTLVFDVHPKNDAEGVFNGRIYLNAATGALLRAEGTFVKSPSMFIEDVKFVKDYGEFDGLTLPTHVHSESETHIAGHAVLDVYHRDYRVESATQSASR